MTHFTRVKARRSGLKVLDQYKSLARLSHKHKKQGSCISKNAYNIFLKSHQSNHQSPVKSSIIIFLISDYEKNKPLGT